MFASTPITGIKAASKCDIYAFESAACLTLNLSFLKGKRNFTTFKLLSSINGKKSSTFLALKALRSLKISGSYASGAKSSTFGAFLPFISDKISFFAKKTDFMPAKFECVFNLALLAILSEFLLNIYLLLCKIALLFQGIL